ncbi:MAG: hypothetical protein JWM09_487 [Francisellaceae bacterium]|nr:hypothetical protein [Francisellaceae bacterium]
MMIGHKIILTIFLSCLSYLFISPCFAEDKWNHFRQQFNKAELAFNKGKYTEFEKLKEQLRDYPLYPYLVYADLERRIDKLSLLEFKDFMNRYSDTPLHEQLRKLWLNTKAKQEKWEDYLHAYVPSEDTGMQCQYLWAKLNVYHNKAVLTKVEPLWLQGKSLPKVCDPLFNAWQENGYLTRALVWQRVKLAIQADNSLVAKRLSKYLKRSEQALVELWVYIHNNPEIVIDPKYFKGRHPALLEMIVHGISRIAKDKPEAAVELWPLIAKRYAFTERHWGLVVRAIGLSYAYKRHPDAEKWLSKVPAMYTNQLVHEWRIRVALSKDDWHGVLHWIEELPPELHHSSQWQYWKARALSKLNKITESNDILQKMVHERNYYGFLANHLLLKPYNTMSQSKITISARSLISVARRPCIARAREFYILKKLNKGQEEWRFATQMMADTERQAAARLALDWQLPKWAIMALANAKDKNAYQLSFPILHSEQIFKAAQLNQIDPAWIFAVTRQESAFMPKAKSHAGAMGLMQIIPSTAKMLARKLNIHLKSLEDVFHIEKNIHFGSHYLKMMLEDNQNNPVLATAAYNAGPNRVKKWMPNFTMAADAWIETIPYNETRNYVKNVLSFTVIYQQILGNQPQLNHYMPLIAGKDALIMSQNNP